MDDVCWHLVVPTEISKLFQPEATLSISQNLEDCSAGAMICIFPSVTFVFVVSMASCYPGIWPFPCISRLLVIKSWRLHSCLGYRMLVVLSDNSYQWWGLLCTLGYKFIHFLCGTSLICRLTIRLQCWSTGHYGLPKRLIVYYQARYLYLI